MVNKFIPDVKTLIYHIITYRKSYNKPQGVSQFLTFHYHKQSILIVTKHKALSSSKSFGIFSVHAEQHQRLSFLKLIEVQYTIPIECFTESGNIKLTSFPDKIFLSNPRILTVTWISGSWSSLEVKYNRRNTGLVRYQKINRNLVNSMYCI